MQQARVVSMSEVIMGIENNTFEMNERYSKRFPEDILRLGALVGGLQFLQSGKAELHRLHPNGYAERVSTFNCIGSGGPYADAFRKLIYNDGMNVEELVGIAGCIVLLIDGMGIDRNVGGKPTGIILKDNEQIHKLTDTEIISYVGKCNPKSVFTNVSANFSQAINKIIEKKKGGNNRKKKK